MQLQSHLELPSMPYVLGHVRHRHPVLPRLERKVRRLIAELDALANDPPRVSEWVVDEQEEGEALETIETLLENVVATRRTLSSEGAARLKQDVRRFLPHLSQPLGLEMERALEVLDEVERFIRDGILGEMGPDLVEFDPGEPGPAEPFDW